MSFLLFLRPIWCPLSWATFFRKGETNMSMRRIIKNANGTFEVPKEPCGTETRIEGPPDGSQGDLDLWFEVPPGFLSAPAGTQVFQEDLAGWPAGFSAIVCDAPLPARMGPDALGPDDMEAWFQVHPVLTREQGLHASSWSLLRTDVHIVAQSRPAYSASPMRALHHALRLLAAGRVC